MAYPMSGRGGRAIFYGHGAADEEFKQNEVERFMREVADGLDGYLSGLDLPMVLVGLEQVVSTYRSVNSYRHVLDDAVVQNPDELSPEELHAAAWPVVAERLREDQERLVARFAELHGTGMASADLAKIEEAAANGRVETLLLSAEPSCWERETTGPPTVHQLGAEGDFAHCELLDRAAVDTLRQGGSIWAVTGSSVPGDGDAAAVFRY
jgi:hypothetical protein